MDRAARCAKAEVERICCAGVRELVSVLWAGGGHLVDEAELSGGGEYMCGGHRIPEIEQKPDLGCRRCAHRRTSTVPIVPSTVTTCPSWSCVGPGGVGARA